MGISGQGVRGHVRRSIEVSLLHVVLIVGAVLILVPFAWMGSTAIKQLEDTFVTPPRWLPASPAWSNFSEAAKQMNLPRVLANTALVTVARTAGQVLVCSLAAFAFARLRFPGRDVLFMIYLATLMVPTQVTMIPAFLLVRQLGWINTYQGIAVPGMFSAFGVFLLRQFFRGIPQDLSDAASIDGASAFTIYWRIFLPLSKPALATLTILTSIYSWNDFLWPLIVTRNSSMQVLSVSLASFQSQHWIEWPLLMAGALIALTPILGAFLLLQRYIVEGIALTGLKG